LADIILQPLRKRIENDPAARRRAQAFMHDQPSFELHLEAVRQDVRELRIAGGERVLADADPETGADGRELGEIAVGFERKTKRRQVRRPRQDGADRRRLTVIADEIVTGEVVERFGHAASVEIGPMYVEAERNCADMACDERTLFWRDHAHGNIGRLTQDVLDRVRG